MRDPYKYVLSLGCALATAAILWMFSGGLQAQSGGGFPSRPAFQSVGIGQAAPSGTGGLSITGNVSAAGQSQTFGTAAGSFSVVTLRESGSGYSAYNATDNNGNSICTILNVSGGTVCNVPTGNFGIGYSTIFPFGIYRAGVCQLCITTAGVVSFGANPAASTITGSGTLTYTSGCTTGTFAPTYRYTITGNTATVTFGASTCTSTAGGLNAGGVPAALQPTTSGISPMVLTTNNSLNTAGFIVINPANANLLLTPTSAAFAGVSGLSAGSTITYAVN
jgi:hypothetical protein